MGLIHRFSKHSTEQYSKTISYIDRLPTGATVSSAAVGEATDLLDGASYAAGGTAVVGTPSTTTTSTALLFKNGTDGHVYLVTVKSTLSDASVLVDTVIMTVQDRTT